MGVKGPSMTRNMATVQMSGKTHKHRFDIPAESKVRLYRYEQQDGVTTSDLSGFDIVRGFKCTCGKFKATDLRRETV